jgi:hypothetical protein
MNTPLCARYYFCINFSLVSRSWEAEGLHTARDWRTWVQPSLAASKTHIIFTAAAVTQVPKGLPEDSPTTIFHLSDFCPEIGFEKPRLLFMRGVDQSLVYLK